MIVEKAFLNKIKDFGLNSYEAKIWTALLSRGIATAGELSDISNVPRSRAYDVLESLEKKGFIVMKIGKPIKYIAVQPEEVVSRVKKKISDDTTQQLNILDELKGSDVMAELTLLHTKGIQKTDPTEMSASLKGRENIYNQLASMIGNAKKEVCIVTTDEGLVRKAEDLKRAFKKASDNGVKIKILAPINAKNQKLVGQLKPLADVKQAELGRFAVIDGKEALFMVVSDKEVQANYDVGIWVSSPFFAQALQSMFNQHWNAL